LNTLYFQVDVAMILLIFEKCSFKLLENAGSFLYLYDLYLQYSPLFLWPKLLCVDIPTEQK
jgi:hypothetical protein